MPVKTQVWMLVQTQERMLVQTQVWMLVRMQTEMAHMTPVQKVANAGKLKRLRRAAALSGFVPEGAAEAIPPLEALPYFLAHGTADPIVPFEKAEHARRILESKGASVTFCSDEVAHKVGARCMKSLETFFSSEPESSSSP